MRRLAISLTWSDEVSTGRGKTLAQQIVTLEAEDLVVAERAFDFGAGPGGNAMTFSKDSRDGDVHCCPLPGLAAAVGRGSEAAASRCEAVSHSKRMRKNH
jgi:hypothetical protein